MNKCSALSVVLVFAFVTLSAGQQTLDKIPGYESSQSISKTVLGLAPSSPIRQIEWTPDGAAMMYTLKGEKRQLKIEDLSEAKTTAQGVVRKSKPQLMGMNWDPAVGRAQQRAEEISPDKKWKAVYRDFNVWLEKGEKAGDAQAENVQVTRDGTERVRYGTGCWVYGEELYQSRAMWWSPDSKTLVFYKVDEQHMEDYFLTENNTATYTTIKSVRYPKAGRPNPKMSLMVLDLDSLTTSTLKIEGHAEQYIYNIGFTPDGSELLFSRTNRRQNELDVMAANIATGAIRTVVSEQQDTWQDNIPVMKFLDDGQRFIWETERNGWKHYELRHLDGRRLNPLSEVSDYPCESVQFIDEQAGFFYYSAFSGPNPLNAHLHRVKFDGTDHVKLSDGAFHYSEFSISPSHRHFVARFERIDTPASTGLFDDQGELLKILFQGDFSAAGEKGIPKPELFSFKADDGKTDIWGYLHKPSNFDPRKKYPLVIDVYGGPQSVGVTNQYNPVNPNCEFGFVIAKIGNRGTINRGKAFESANYLALGNPDLNDQRDGVRFLANRDYIDGSRVGIFGHSYGGYMSALAVLKYPDDFHVAVSGAPVTDWQNYDTIYSERYMRTPEENKSGYREGSAMEYAKQLKGKLLLVHGLIDDNVHPANTWQLVKKLQDSAKRFDLMVYPGFQHGIGSTYFSLRWEYLIQNLKPTEPVK